MLGAHSKALSRTTKLIPRACSTSFTYSTTSAHIRCIWKRCHLPYNQSAAWPLNIWCPWGVDVHKRTDTLIMTETGNVLALDISYIAPLDHSHLADSLNIERPRPRLASTLYQTILGAALAWKHQVHATHLPFTRCFGALPPPPPESSRLQPLGLYLPRSRCPPPSGWCMAPIGRLLDPVRGAFCSLGGQGA